MSADSDEKLISRTARGDARAFEDLYDRFGRRAFALAFRILRDHAWAEDAVQEAFTSLWRMAGTYRPERGAASSWLLAIVHHRAVDTYRKVRAGVPAGWIQGEDREPAGGADVAQLAIESLEQRRVRCAVDLLPEEQRDAILLAYFGGLSHSEIAIRQKVPLGTVKGRIRLGMEKLRNLLDQQSAGGVR